MSSFLPLKSGSVNEFLNFRQESLAQAAAPGNKDVASTQQENWGEEMTTTDWANEPAPAGAGQPIAAAAAAPAAAPQKFQVNDDWATQV